MKIEGSCYCGLIQFETESKCSTPIQRCYCKQCRKCNGSPVSTYLQCSKDSLKISRGKEQITTFHTENATRQFCSQCGSTLFFTHTAWNKDIFSSASAIDTPLQSSDQYVHIFVKDKADWFSIDTPGPIFDEYSGRTSLEWHKQFNLEHE